MQKRPRDFNQRGKLIVDIATGQVADEPPKDSAAAEMGRKGGAARAAKLSPRERRAIAVKGATARWKK